MAPRKSFRVTWETVTPESAEIGEAEAHGFVYSGLGEFELSKCDADPSMTLREAVNLVGLGLEISGRWFTQFEGVTDYRTGAETRYSLHPPDTLTGASYRRLGALLRAS